MDFSRILMLTALFLASVICIIDAKDYYDLLGISRDATDRQIKKAFHKLATKYHPDKNKDKGAEDKFREIAQAYEILSDPEKRKQYDQFGEAAFADGGQHQYHHQNFHFNFNDFFKEFDDDFGRAHEGNAFKFSFGGGDGGFFNDFWGDDGGIDESDFGFSDFEQFGSRDSFFGSHFGHFDGDVHHSRQHSRHHKTFHSHSSSSDGRSTEARAQSEGGRTCKTVTQRVGKVVTTYTQCS